MAPAIVNVAYEPRPPIGPIHTTTTATPFHVILLRGTTTGRDDERGCKCLTAKTSSVAEIAVARIRLLLAFQSLVGLFNTVPGDPCGRGILFVDI